MNWYFAIVFECLVRHFLNDKRQFERRCFVASLFLAFSLTWNSQHAEIKVQMRTLIEWEWVRERENSIECVFDVKAKYFALLLLPWWQHLFLFSLNHRKVFCLTFQQKVSNYVQTDWTFSFSPLRQTIVSEMRYKASLVHIIKAKR